MLKVRELQQRGEALDLRGARDVAERVPAVGERLKLPDLVVPASLGVLPDQSELASDELGLARQRSLKNGAHRTTSSCSPQQFELQAYDVAPTLFVGASARWLFEVRASRRLAPSPVCVVGCE